MVSVAITRRHISSYSWSIVSYLLCGAHSTAMGKSSKCSNVVSRHKVDFILAQPAARIMQYTISRFIMYHREDIFQAPAGTSTSYNKK